MDRPKEETGSIAVWTPEQIGITSDSDARGISYLIAFLAYLAYLRSMRSSPSSEGRVSRMLIVAVAVVLVVVALVAAGRSELVAQVLENWPILP